MPDLRIPFEPRGSAKEIWDGPHCRAREVVLAGPAGTGKTRSALEKVHLICQKYPGTRALFCRKHRTDLIAAGIQTFKDFVLHERDGVMFVGASGDHPGEYRYPRKNGKQSTIVLGGLDKDAKNIMSREFDIIYLQEATECVENDWENLTTRLRGVSVPYSQLIGDCNPSYPTHWLKQRGDKGLTHLFSTSHKDNPLYWDPELQRWTGRGQEYILNTLGALTGVRRSRLLEGKWIAAEGQVYPGWNPEIHVIEPFNIPDDWPRYHTVDFGFTNPFVYHWYAEDHDGRLYLYREIYMSHRLVEDHAITISSFKEGEPRPQAILCDHDAEDRATLERHIGMPTEAADKAVSIGIQNVQARLRVQKDGKSRLFVFKSDVARGYGLVERDPYLEQAKKPLCTVEEFDAYVWNRDPEGLRGEEPVKKDDHGMDASRYMIQYLDGGSPGSWMRDDDDDNWYEGQEFDYLDAELNVPDDPDPIVV